MMRVFSVLRSEQETVLALKSFSDAERLPPGLISKGVDAMKEALGNFQKAKEADKHNEARLRSTRRNSSLPRWSPLRSAKR